MPASLPARARKNALLAPNHAQRLGAFLLPTAPHPLDGSAATWPLLRFTDAAKRHLGLRRLVVCRFCDGLPSPSQVPPIRNPKKPRVPPSLGLLLFCSLVSTLEHSVDGSARFLLLPVAATILAPPCASASPPGTSTRSGSGSISSAASSRRSSPTCSACKRSNASTASSPSSSSARSAFRISRCAGQKGYHGVATLSRLPFSLQERRDICGRGHARHLSVALDGANGRRSRSCCTISMCPAGGDIPDPALNEKFRHKLDFLEAMEAWFGAMRGKAQEPHDHGRRSERRAAADRCLVAQATAQSGEPHAGRDRALRARAGLA